MKLNHVKYICDKFYRRFSVLNLHPFQLKIYNTADSVSIALIRKSESAAIQAALYITGNSVRLLKINVFDKIDSTFQYDSPLELYTNLLTLMLLCCYASGAIVPISDAVSVTIGRKINNWRELVTVLCSLLPKEQGTITVYENHQYIKFLKTEFRITDGVLLTDGLHKSRTPFKDTIELIHAVLTAVSAVLKIHGYIIDPFSISRER